MESVIDISFSFSVSWNWSTTFYVCKWAVLYEYVVSITWVGHCDSWS